MNDVKLVDELERKMAFHREQYRRYKEALKVLKGKSPAKRASAPRAGGIPAHVAAVLKNGPLTSAQIVEALEKAGKEVTLRDISLALSRYIREGRIFQRDHEGRYDLIEE